MTPGTPRFAALCLTHDCNLRCSYCYAGTKTRRAMSAETARRAIDFICDAAGAPCTFTFFGGEPLLEFELVREIVAWARARHADRAGFRMSTNATLLDPARLEYLRVNRIAFAVSIDGTAAQHDRCRPRAGGGGSHAAILRNVPEILRTAPWTVAVSVITPGTAADLADGVRELFQRGFRYVLQTLDYSADWREAELGALESGYRTLVDFYHDHLRAGRNLYYSPFDERIKTRARRPYAKTELCDLADTQVAIAASGRIYPCVQFVGEDGSAEAPGVIGDVFTGFDPARRRRFVDENRAPNETCAGCALDGRCATYCGCVNWRATGSLRTPPAVICAHERMLMPIVDRLANRLWRERDPLFRRKFYDRSFPVSSFIEDCLTRGEA